MNTLYAVALLACPVGMGLMMWLMMRSRHTVTGAVTGRRPHRDPVQDAEIQRLRDELDELRHAGTGEPDGAEERHLAR